MNIRCTGVFVNQLKSQAGTLMLLCGKRAFIMIIVIIVIIKVIVIVIVIIQVIEIVIVIIKVIVIVIVSGGRNGATDSLPDCYTMCGTVAGFESLTLIQSPICLEDPGYIIDT